MPQALREIEEKNIRIAKTYGEVEVRADTLNEEDRTVEVCWSTGARVKRYSYDEGYYLEELQVDAKSVRLDRFNAMSLLDSHDNYSMDQRLGTVVPGTVRFAAGKAYARIKFSKKQRAEELFQDIRDGHPLPISVGYKTHRYEKTEADEGKLPVLRATDWEPMELSAVPIPADAGATSRSEPKQTDSDEIVLLRQYAPTKPAAADNEEKPMNKREAAKKFTGEQLDALALGAGLSRSASETDDALRVRLLAAYDEEDKQVREADEAQKRAVAEAVAHRVAADAEAARALAEGKNAPTPVGLTAAEAAAAGRKAVNDERTRVREIEALAVSAKFKTDDALVRAAVDGDTTVEQFRSQMVDAMIARQDQSPTFPVVETRGMQDAMTTQRALIANAVLHRHNVVPTLMDGANEWRGMAALDIAKELLRMRGEDTRGSVHDVVKRALHTTSDFPAILGDITRQTLMAGYNGYENTFELISNRNVLSDFRETKMLEMGQAPDLKKVNEHGEFTRGTVRESEEGLQLASYGRIIGLTRQMIINDQLGAFTQLIANWGRKVKKLEGDIVWGAILENVALKDGNGLYHAQHANILQASALDLDNLKKARTQFRKQKDIDGEAINIAPKYLFIGSELEVAAQSLLTGVGNPQTQAEVVPEAIRSLQPIYEYRLDKITTKAWFLFAAKEATMGRGLQHAYLAGQETPRYDERIGFDVDGIEYKIAHDFGAGVTDYRFTQRNLGVN